MEVISSKSYEEDSSEEMDNINTFTNENFNDSKAGDEDSKEADSQKEKEGNKSFSDEEDYNGSGAEEDVNKTTDLNIQNNKAIPFVIFDQNKFSISDEAKRLLTSQKYENIAIISLVGKYRTGKSFLLNRVFLNGQNSEESEFIEEENELEKGFNVGSTIRPCTKGIWICTTPLTIKNSYFKEEFPCFLIDTEGLEAYDEEINHDSKIFIIAILISSLFIFNSFGAIDETALNSLSFVLNLSKELKIKNSLKEDNEEELAEFLPNLLWLLRDFHLKLEDKNGNVITEKQYLETALENVKGSSDTVEEKNRIRNLIKAYFPERDCFTMVRPCEDENDLQNLNNLPFENMRKEFVDQVKIFRNKVIKKVKPKMFKKNLLNGSMLLDYVQSILDAINSGGIPIIENSWKYIMKSECMNLTKITLNDFINEVNSYIENEKNSENFYKNVKSDMYKISQKYLNNFTSNKNIDEDIKTEFIEIMKGKLDSELKKFNKENEKLFEEKFTQDLNSLSQNFMDQFTTTDIYEKNSIKFFQDFEDFREKAISTTPDFPNKNDILFEKVLQIIKKFINSKIMKIKVINEEKNFLKTENDKNEEILGKLNEDLEFFREKNNEYLNKLNNDIIIERKKHKRIEEKINNFLSTKNEEIDQLKIKISSSEGEYEKKINELLEMKDNIDRELKLKEEQLMVMKMNNEKITSLFDQKSSFLEKEINLWKEKYNNSVVESKNKQSELNKENLKLKEQNKILNENISNSNSNSGSNNNNNQNVVPSSNNNNKKNNNIDNLMSYVKIQLKEKGTNKFKLEKFLKDKKDNNKFAAMNAGGNPSGTPSNTGASNNKSSELPDQNKINQNMEININNNKSKAKSKSKSSDKKTIQENNSLGEEYEKSNKNEKIDKNDNSKILELSQKLKNGEKDMKIRTLEEQLINFNQYRDLINNAKDFKCKFCMNSFNFIDFKEHYNHCSKNPHNQNDSSNKNSNTNSNNNLTVVNQNNQNIGAGGETIVMNQIPPQAEYAKTINNYNNFITFSNNINKNITKVLINKNNKSDSISTSNNSSNKNKTIIINGIKKLTNNNSYLSNANDNNNKNINSNININNGIITSGTSLKKNFYTSANNNSNNITGNNNLKNNAQNALAQKIIFNPKKLKIKIVKGRIRKDKTGKPYLEYILELNYNNNKQWNINRRFNQFTNLYKTIRSICKAKENITLPESSNFFTNIGTLFSGLSHENKILSLEKFLKDLTETEGINNCKALMLFLDMHQICENTPPPSAPIQNKTIIQNNSKEKKLIPSNYYSNGVNSLVGSEMNSLITTNLNNNNNINSVKRKLIRKNDIVGRENVNENLQNVAFEPYEMKSNKEVITFNYKLSREG